MEFQDHSESVLPWALLMVILTLKEGNGRKQQGGEMMGKRNLPNIKWKGFWYAFHIMFWWFQQKLHEKNPDMLTTGTLKKIKIADFVVHLMCMIMDIKFDMIILNGRHSINWTIDVNECYLNNSSAHKLIHTIETHFSSLRPPFRIQMYLKIWTSLCEGRWNKINRSGKRSTWWQATLFWISLVGGDPNRKLFCPS